MAMGMLQGILAPGGYVVQPMPGEELGIGPRWFSQCIHFAFNGDGGFLTFDSDMEWDWGMPWYRPVRVNHCVDQAPSLAGNQGPENGPPITEISLGAIDIGIGCPTGVGNSMGAKTQYQQAILSSGPTAG